jgi:hypothetical protein
MALLVTLASSASVRAQLPAPTARPALTDEQLNRLNEFIRANPSCTEMANGCHVCVRQPPATPQCSTPGISCVAEAWQCKKRADGKQ